MAHGGGGGGSSYKEFTVKGGGFRDANRPTTADRVIKRYKGKSKTYELDDVFDSETLAVGDYIVDFYGSKAIVESVEGTTFTAKTVFVAVMVATTTLTNTGWTAEGKFYTKTIEIAGIEYNEFTEAYVEIQTLNTVKTSDACYGRVFCEATIGGKVKLYTTVAPTSIHCYIGVICYGYCDGSSASSTFVSSQAKYIEVNDYDLSNWVDDTATGISYIDLAVAGLKLGNVVGKDTTYSNSATLVNIIKETPTEVKLLTDVTAVVTGMSSIKGIRLYCKTSLKQVGTCNLKFMVQTPLEYT